MKSKAATENNTYAQKELLKIFKKKHNLVAHTSKDETVFTTSCQFYHTLPAKDGEVKKPHVWALFFQTPLLDRAYTCVIWCRKVQCSNFSKPYSPNHAPTLCRQTQSSLVVAVTAGASATALRNKKKQTLLTKGRICPKSNQDVPYFSPRSLSATTLSP